ncbi:MAG: hypothetical protein ABIP46_09665, partial [Polaromonas sp.]
MHVISRLLLLLCLALCSMMCQAQDEDEIAGGFQRLSAEEAARLQAVLAQPVPAGTPPKALHEYFRSKDLAALRLGDQHAREAGLRQWALALPDDYLPKTNLAALLRGQQKYDEAIAFRRQAIERARAPTINAVLRIRLAMDLYEGGYSEEARKALDDARQNLDAVARSRNWSPQGQSNLIRARFEVAQGLSLLHRRFGRWNESVASAQEAEKYARQALELGRSLPAGAQSDAAKYFISSDLGNALAQKTHSLREAGRLAEAEESLKSYLRVSREIELPPGYLSGIYAVAANLRFSQREFVQAESYARKSDKILEALAYEPVHPSRLARAQDLIIALQGQKRWPQALAEFDRLDGLAGQDKALRGRVLFPAERALAYLWTGKPDQAADLLAGLSAGNLKRYGAGHFFPAQSSGLQGVALWRTATAANRAKALPLLKNAVRDFMAPANADFMENVGYRKEVRELIFATYLEALATTSGEDATQALGPADWVRGGVVQDALADAAVRSAAADPALSDLVRSEQDAKNEVLALRKYLAGEAGGASTPLPEVAGKIRARIAELESTRRGFQAQLKVKFPDYDRLVRPAPPAADDIAKSLSADEALVMLLPTEDAVYIWAVTSGAKPLFVRAALPQKELTRLVRSARSTLDFAEMGGKVQPFNAAAASELYQRLLAPLQAALQGKKQLVIAAGGALSQLPFGVLLTQPVQSAGVDAPWLIRQSAVTQVPSVSAWLALKQLGRAKSAPEPLLGWGDPQFGARTEVAAAGQTRQVVLTRASTTVDLETEDARSALRYGEIPALPETRGELLAIAAILKADPQRDLRLGAQATKASVMESNRSGELLRKKVLVFATHGLMAGDLPNLTQPALALAATGAEAQDPLGALLTLEEVLSLKLNADWVVLSACNTAAADGKAEEALSG